MQKCPSCGQLMLSGSRVCPKCGMLVGQPIAHRPARQWTIVLVAIIGMAALFTTVALSRKPANPQYSPGKATIAQSGIVGKWSDEDTDEQFLHISFADTGLGMLKQRSKGQLFDNGRLVGQFDCTYNAPFKWAQQPGAIVVELGPVLKTGSETEFKEDLREGQVVRFEFMLSGDRLTLQSGDSVHALKRL